MIRTETEPRETRETTRPRFESEPRQASIPTLLRQLATDVSILLRKELALATSEVTHSVQEAKSGAIGLVTGGAVLYAGLLFLLGAATLGLAEVLPGWAAALTVGGAVALIGLIMVQANKKKVTVRNFAPERAAHSMNKDKDLVERHTS